ncbi:hypothetical protein P4V54_20255 [Brevibacillus nitrificans]|uniref:hypothetical protein n=1 Tax=Brevibacillus nitrificans TaxID=651560 RepID=UPI002E1E57FC|nr:hypothetical protein [Brevibacillus nitrificans]
MSSKLEQTEKLAIEALQSTKTAHKRLDELSKQLDELEKKFDEDKKQNKDDKKWIVGTLQVGGSNPLGDAIQVQMVVRNAVLYYLESRVFILRSFYCVNSSTST